MSPPVRVAVGVLRDSLGRVLIALRPSHKHQGDLWEFPGGKIEVGESAETALRRELSEELGVFVRRSVPLVSVPFAYADKEVVLEVREVISFEGEPRGIEGQVIRWVSLGELASYQFPAANTPILRAVRLPESICITALYSGADDFQRRLERAMSLGVGMLLFRPVDAAGSTTSSVRTAIDSCRQAKLPVVLSSVISRDLWQFADGIHLRAQHLAALDRRPVDESKLLGASCHNLQEAERAQSLGVDYLFLSPVLQTDSHPEVSGLGWEGFELMASSLRVPAYALGGVTPTHLTKAKESGAKGIAGISGFWK